MTGPSDELIALYRSTRYDVRLPGGRRVALSVDAAPPETFLRWAGDATYVFVTAHNPRSTPQPAATNRAAQRALLGDLRSLGARVLAGAGRGDGWREPSLVAAGLDLDAIDALATRYAQHAVLVGRGRSAVALRCYGNT